MEACSRKSTMAGSRNAGMKSFGAEKSDAFDISPTTIHVLHYIWDI